MNKKVCSICGNNLFNSYAHPQTNKEVCEHCFFERWRICSNCGKTVEKSKAVENCFCSTDCQKEFAQSEEVDCFYEL